MRWQVVFFFLILVQTVSAQSIGVSPSTIIKDNLLAGSMVDEVIVFSKSGADPINLTVTLQGDASNWITHPQQIVLSDSTIRIPTRIQVPHDTPLGEYSATLTYIDTLGDTIHSALSVPFVLEVTNEIDDRYVIRRVQTTQEDEITWLSFEVHNEGNIISGPTLAAVTFYDYTREEQLLSVEGEVESVPPFSITPRIIPLTTHLTTGNYWAHIQLQDTTIVHDEWVFLEILADSQEPTSASDQLLRIDTEDRPAGQIVFELLKGKLWLFLLAAVTLIIPVTLVSRAKKR